MLLIFSAHLRVRLGFPEMGRVATQAHDAIRGEDHELALEQLVVLVGVIEQELASLAPAESNRAA